MTKLVVVGTGGQAKVVLDALEGAIYSQVVFVDPFSLKEEFLGFKVFRNILDIPERDDVEFLIAIGDNYRRSKVADSICSARENPRFATVVHRHSYVARSAVLSSGTIVCAGAVIGPNSTVGQHVIVNTNSSIDHDCCVCDFASLGPNSCLGGNVHIGYNSVVAIGASVLHNTSVANFCVLGAASTLLNNMHTDFEVWFGTPASYVRKRSKDEKYL